PLRTRTFGPPTASSRVAGSDRHPGIVSRHPGMFVTFFSAAARPPLRRCFHGFSLFLAFSRLFFFLRPISNGSAMTVPWHSKGLRYRRCVSAYDPSQVLLAAASGVELGSNLESGPYDPPLGLCFVQASHERIG